MFCKTFRNRISPENLDKFTKIIKEQRRPLVSKLEGFKGTYYATKPNGEFIEITLWETEAQVRAWAESPDREKLGAQAVPLFTGSPLEDLYEVQDFVIP